MAGRQNHAGKMFDERTIGPCSKWCAAPRDWRPGRWQRESNGMSKRNVCEAVTGCVFSRLHPTSRLSPSLCSSQESSVHEGSIGNDNDGSVCGSDSAFYRQSEGRWRWSCCASFSVISFPVLFLLFAWLPNWFCVIIFKPPRLFFF